jgi:hypothetical protein
VLQAFNQNINYSMGLAMEEVAVGYALELAVNKYSFFSLWNNIIFSNYSTSKVEKILPRERYK